MCPANWILHTHQRTQLVSTRARARLYHSHYQDRRSEAGLIAELHCRVPLVLPKAAALPSLDAVTSQQAAAAAGMAPAAGTLGAVPPAYPAVAVAPAAEVNGAMPYVDALTEQLRAVRLLQPTPPSSASSAPVRASAAAMADVTENVAVKAKGKKKGAAAAAAAQPPPPPLLPPAPRTEMDRRAALSGAAGAFMAACDEAVRELLLAMNFSDHDAEAIITGALA